jgi:hypothetical protein
MTLIVLFLIVMCVMAIPIILEVIFVLIKIIIGIGSWIIAISAIYYIATKIFNL